MTAEEARGKANEIRDSFKRSQHTKSYPKWLEMSVYFNLAYYLRGQEKDGEIELVNKLYCVGKKEVEKTRIKIDLITNEANIAEKQYVQITKEIEMMAGIISAQKTCINNKDRVIEYWRNETLKADERANEIRKKLDIAGNEHIAQEEIIHRFKIDKKELLDLIIPKQTIEKKLYASILCDKCSFHFCSEIKEKNLISGEVKAICPICKTEGMHGIVYHITVDK